MIKFMINIKFQSLKAQTKAAVSLISDVMNTNMRTSLKRMYSEECFQGN